MERFDVCVRGTGAVGSALALALSRLGLKVALLRRLKVWDALTLVPGAVTAVHDMKVAGDDAGAHIEFSAWQQCVGALAWIVDAARLEAELATAVRFAPHVELRPGDAGPPD